MIFSSPNTIQLIVRIKVKLMGRACGTDGVGEKYVPCFGGRIGKKEDTWKT